METEATTESSRPSTNAPDDIMNAETLEGEDHSGETRPLNLWECVFRHALFPESFAVHSEASPRRRPPRPACSLLSLAPNQRKPRR